MPTLLELSALLGFLLRAIGFAVAGFVLGRLVLDNFQTTVWQVQIALVLGLFGLIVGLTDFASPGSAGAFALGVGLAYFVPAFTQKPEQAKDKGQ